MPELYEHLLLEVQNIEAFALQQGTSPIASRDIPVHFTSIQSTQGSPYISLADVNQSLALLNQRFSGTGFNFYHCGPISYIYRTEVRDHFDVDQFISRFSYNYGVMEVYVRNNSSSSTASLPCPLAYQGGNPNTNVTCDEHQNIVNITGQSLLLNSTFPHEVGHHFGLLHTHHFVWPVYQSPPLSGQLDHPYPVVDQNNQIVPG